MRWSVPDAYRRSAVTLTGIVLLAVSLRVGVILVFGHDAWYPSMVYANANLAQNLSSGHGYVITASPEAMAAVQLPFARLLAEIPSLQEMGRLYPGVPGTEPNPQYLPGFPYLVAVLWAVIPGDESYTVVQLTTGLLDGIVGPIAIWSLLAMVGWHRAGTLAAFGYAIQPGLIYQSTRFLPDSMSAVLPVLAAALLVFGICQRREWQGAVAAGGLLGLAGWLRGDYLAVFVLLAMALLLFSKMARLQRATVLAVFVVAWAVPSVALSSFYAHHYGDFQLTRPGTGLLLWEGIGQQENPWGIQAPEGGNLDHAAIALLEEHGYEYGYWEGDAFLLSEVLSHMKEDPGWFAVATARRALRVVSFRTPGVPPWLATSISLALAPFVVSGAVMLARRSRLVAGVLCALFLSRVLPFSLMYDQTRFLILLLPVYSACTAVMLAWLLTRFARGEGHVKARLRAALEWLGPSPAVTEDRVAVASLGRGEVP